jgi:type VI secretion system VasD/TssJ family lipoprotein
MGLNRLGFAGLARWGAWGARLSAVLAALAGCAHAPDAAAPPCEKPEALRVALSASGRVNPDDAGAALATVVRLYQLKGLEKLQLASFDDVLGHDRETLGDDFAAVQELTINPGDRLTPAVPRNADATYVVAVALFRRPTSVTWRAVKKLAAPDPQYCHAKDPAAAARATIAFSLDDNRIEVQ